MKFSALGFFLIFLTALVGCNDTSNEGNLNHTTYYVDALEGDDLNDGSMDAPLKSLDKVNQLNLQAGDQILFKRGTYYRGALYPASGNSMADVYYGAYGEGSLPIIACSINATNHDNWIQLSEHVYVYKESIPYDVGNMIFDSGDGGDDYFTVTDQTSFGIKKWSIEALSTTGDYFYDMESNQLYLYSEIAPTNMFFNIECCLNVGIIDQEGASYITYEDLHLTFGSGHGIGGGNTHHITIKGLEISYIGGSFLHYMNDVPTRYGNAIEFWANASDHLVENCLIYEIFDTGLTNQNNGSKANQERITYSNNTIYKCGMASFEIDNGPKTGKLEDIYFTRNTCSDVGYGWAMTQDRFQDPMQNGGLGHHVTSFFIETPTKNIHIENNVFDGYTHADGLGSFYLLNNVDKDSHEGIIIKNNTYLRLDEYFAIIINAGEITFMDEDDFDNKYNK